MKTMKLLVATLFLMISSVTFGQPSASVMPPEVQFVIQSAMNYNRDNGGYWDIPGDQKIIAKNSNIQVWFLNGGVDRKYTLVQSAENGYYEIYVGDTKSSRVDISGGGSTKNGTSVQVWENTGKQNQRFLFQHLGKGRFKIFDRNGKIICLAGKSSKNGSNVHIWDNHDGVWAEWYIIDAKTKRTFIPTQTQEVAERMIQGDAITVGENFWIQSAMDYNRDDNGFWDLPGFDKTQLGTAIQVWGINGGDDRKFRFEKKRNSPYYQIYVGMTSDGVVDIKGGAEDGAKVQVGKVSGGADQDFYLKHLGGGRYKIYHKSGKILSLEGRKNGNGSKIILWKDHDGIHNEWYIRAIASPHKAFNAEGNPTTQTVIQTATETQTESQTSTSTNTEASNKIVFTPDADIFSLISGGQQSTIDAYFKKVDLSVLTKADNGAIVKAINSLEPKDKVNQLIYVMNGTKENTKADVRGYVYTELEKADYNKTPFLLKALITKYLKDFKESDPNLAEKVNAIQRKIN